MKRVQDEGLLGPGVVQGWGIGLVIRRAQLQKKSQWLKQYGKKYSSERSLARVYHPSQRHVARIRKDLFLQLMTSVFDSKTPFLKGCPSRLGIRAGQWWEDGESIPIHCRPLHTTAVISARLNQGLHKTSEQHKTSCSDRLLPSDPAGAPVPCMPASHG